MEYTAEKGRLWRRVRRGVLSAFVVFHLAAVTLAPNTNSLIGKKLVPVFEPYLSFFELTNSWSFFAPDPGPPPVFVEWELLDKSGNMVGTGSMPEGMRTAGMRESLNRRLAAVEFMILSDDRIQKMLVPYLCRKQQGVHSVKVWKKMIPIPPIDDVANGKRALDDGEQTDRRWVSRTFCDGGTG